MTEEEVPAPDLAFYHWSPVARRKSINRYGLRPGSLSLGREWRPPFVCFSDNPQLAWTLSGRIHPEVSEWDLWQVYADDVTEGYEVIFDHFVDTGRRYPKEYRVYHRVFKRDLWHVATRAGE